MSSAETPPPETPSPSPAPVVFRIPRMGILVALVLGVCCTPFAGGGPWFLLIYLLPVAAIVWIVRVRTTVDADSLTVRRIVGGKRVAWDAVSSLRLGNRSRVRAVLADGAELPLPAVHVRDLPALAAASGGRLPDPAGE